MELQAVEYSETTEDSWVFIWKGYVPQLDTSVSFFLIPRDHSADPITLIALIDIIPTSVPDESNIDTVTVFIADEDFSRLTSQDEVVAYVTGAILYDIHYTVKEYVTPSQIN